MRRIIFILGTLLATIAVSAQQIVTVQAQSYQVSDNLDLEAVAITFGESKNIEDFERRLNDPENRISNLDLNNDGYVDFLRVVEVEEKGTHLIVIQAVIGQDLYQDVASVIVEGETKTSTTVTIVGNRDIYGDNYVIVPRYTVRPVIFDWFWLPTYVVYRSLWYWDYYPHYYHHYTCLGYHSYHRYIHTWHTHHHHHCDFHRPVEYHHHNHHVEMHRTVARNDYATQRPNQSYRTEPTPNRHLETLPSPQSRPAGSSSTSPNYKADRPTTRTQSTTTTTTTRRPATTTTAPASTSRRTTQSTTTRTSSEARKSTTLPARPTTSTTTRKATTTSATTTNSRTTTATPRTTTSTSRTTTARSSSTSSNRSTNSTSSSVRPSTSSSSRSTSKTNTSVRPSSSTSRPSGSTTRTTSTAVKTNKNTSITRR